MVVTFRTGEPHDRGQCVQRPTYTAGKGRASGSLHAVKPVMLVAGLMQALAARYGLATAHVGDAILGCATPCDEHMRPDTTAQGLAALPPAFAELGAGGFDATARRRYPQVEAVMHRHTAGDSPGIVDGAALVRMGSADIGRALGLTPRARIVSAALVEDEPTIMLTGPPPATRKALTRAGMTIADVDIIECNGAFAAVVLKFLWEMGLDDIDRINVDEEANASGHPLGATGAMLLATAPDELERRDRTICLVTLCGGGEMGIATISERV